MSSAVFSEDRAYRYELHRTFEDGGLPLEDPNPKRLALWVMLNPSTADEVVNDRTIARCISFSKLWGMSGLMVGNCYALRSTDPQELFRRGHRECIGNLNDGHLERMASQAHLIIAAWGIHCELERERAVLAILRNRRNVHVLGLTKDRRPMHPLYIKGDTPPIPWEP